MKKAQIKMGETIAIMVIFFFLLVLGFGIYSNVQRHTYSVQQEKQINEKAVQITQLASYLPELQCSVQNVQYDNCFDKQKAEIFYDLVKGDEDLIQRYSDIFGTSTLYIVEIFPSTGTPIYLFNQSISEGSKQTKKSMVPVSLYDGQTKKFSIAILYIEYSVPK